MGAGGLRRDCAGVVVVATTRWCRVVVEAMGGNDEMGNVEEESLPPPHLDLYEPLLEKEKVATAGNANGNVINGTHHTAMIGTRVAPIESLDYE